MLRLVTAGLVAALIVSGWQPYDRVTWLLEVLPILVVLPILWATRRTFPLTALVYAGILLHGIVLAAGGAYTYARVPLGFQIADWLHVTRNPYDKVGHFFQGFVPALAIREILIRGDHVRGRKMLVFVTLSIVLAVSATYELLEWVSALALGQGADEFLGTQGDIWDTQSDMFSAIVGGVSALVLLTRVHNRQIERVRGR